MARSGIHLSFVLAILASFAAPSWATTRECILASIGEYRECKGDCKEEFQVAKDACSNKDHVCVDACREERSDCREATGFDADIAACNATKETAIANCKSLYDPDTLERDQCIDNAQLDAFRCRDQAREDNKLELKACRTAFKTCRSLCPPGTGPVVDPVTCKIEAKDACKACRAACREDFQISKDACRNLDHDCVEGCRTNRQACKAPVQTTLDAALADCKATKLTAIAACNGDDTCIDQAQAVAFQCRDDAREAARPGFQACRQTFNTCVLSCPPASD